VGMNVYDILKFNNLIISKDALAEVEKKLIWFLKKKK
jgi:ribosomal protein L4